MAADQTTKIITAHKGGVARAKKLSAKRRKEIASAGGHALWARIRAGKHTDPATKNEA